MGCKGALGFYVAGVSKITYVHDNAQLEELGESVVGWCRQNTIVNGWAGSRKKALAMKKTTPDLPTSEQIHEVLPNVSRPNIPGGKRDITWFDLLGCTQGKPGSILTARYYIDRKDFLKQSQFCGWAYVINFDVMKLEVYAGNQRHPHQEGRYAIGRAGKKPNMNGFYPVALVARFDLDKIPELWKHDCYKHRVEMV